MEKKYKVVLNRDYYMIPENVKASFEDKIVKEMVLCNKTGNIFFKNDQKINGILAEHQEVFKCGKEYDAIKLNDVYYIFKEETCDLDNYCAGGYFFNKVVLKLPEGSSLINQVKEVNYIPEKYKLFEDGCLVVCVDDSSTTGKDESLNKNKLYQLTDIKFNTKTGKTTAQVVGSKYRWSIDRFVLINNFENLTMKPIMEKLTTKYNKGIKKISEIDDIINIKSATSSGTHLHELYNLLNSIMKN